MSSTDKKNVRLSAKEVRVIKDTIKKYDQNANIIMFWKQDRFNKEGWRY